MINPTVARQNLSAEPASDRVKIAMLALGQIYGNRKPSPKIAVPTRGESPNKIEFKVVTDDEIAVYLDDKLIGFLKLVQP